MKLIVTKPFKFAHAGVRVEEFEVGQKIDTEDLALIDVALEEKWAKKYKEAEPRADLQPPPADPEAPAA